MFSVFLFVFWFRDGRVTSDIEWLVRMTGMVGVEEMTCAVVTVRNTKVSCTLVKVGDLAVVVLVLSQGR